MTEISTFLPSTLAQANDNGTPYLNVSQNMGTIVAICAVLIVIVAVAQKLRKNKAK